MRRAWACDHGAGASPLKIGTLAAILAEVAAKQAIDRETLVDHLFG